MLLNHFVLLKVDMTKPESPGYDIARKFNIAGTPEILFFNRDGELSRLRLAGSVGQKSFTNTINILLKNQ